MLIAARVLEVAHGNKPSLRGSGSFDTRVVVQTPSRASNNSGVELLIRQEMTVKWRGQGRMQRRGEMFTHLCGVRELRAILLDHRPAWPQPRQRVEEQQREVPAAGKEQSSVAVLPHPPLSISLRRSTGPSAWQLILYTKKQTLTQQMLPP